LPQRPELSVIVPLYNEQESVPVGGEISAALAGLMAWGFSWWTTAAGTTRPRSLRGSRPSTARAAAALARNYGQTQAMQAGFDAARGASW
jgi:hypothetical protein